jgi:hypothetical protein
VLPEPSPVFYLVVEFCQETLTVLLCALGRLSETKKIQNQGVVHGGGLVIIGLVDFTRLQLVNFIRQIGQELAQVVKGGRDG